MKQPRLGQLCVICWCFLLISFCVTGNPSYNVILTQTPGSVTQLVSKEMNITCNVKGETLDRLRPCWCKRKEEDGKLEFIVCTTGAKGDLKFYDDNQSKFSMKTNTFPASITLMIKDLQFSDSGTYFCIVEKTPMYIYGNGTKLRVVETLPTTVPPPTTKPPCTCKKPKTSKRPQPGPACSPVIWAPISGFAVILLIGLYFLVSQTYRVYRRTHMYFRKISPK
ncbi:T-cell surface glycoprotein CD8 beta chain [Hyperolius riggenbachi]|uniref:T-cell surface glycoprotein CD8 beta chain n=1 Tax=Hyperolius riggenbachi TaxID=752182 RepID=UPI0035A3C390